MEENGRPVICTGTIDLSGSWDYAPVPATCVLCGKKFDQLVWCEDGKVPQLDDSWYQHNKCRECHDKEWKAARWVRLRHEWLWRVRTVVEVVRGRHDCDY